MTHALQEHYKLESLLSSEDVEWIKSQANNTMQYISHELSAMEYVLGDMLQGINEGSEKKFKTVIDRNFGWPGFLSDGSLERDVFLKRAIYLEEVSKGLTQLKEQLQLGNEDEKPWKKIAANILDSQISRVQQYLTMYDFSEYEEEEKQEEERKK